MVTLDDEEMKIFMKVCLESDKKNILNKSITYPDFCRIICIIGLLKLFAPTFYLSEQFPDYWERYSWEADAKEKIEDEYEDLYYPQYYFDEVCPKEHEWFCDYYRQLTGKQRTIVDNLRNSHI